MNPHVTMDGRRRATHRVAAIVGVLMALAGLTIAPATVLASPVDECQAVTSNQVETSQCLRDTLGAAEQVMAIALDAARTKADSVDQVTGRVVARPALDQSQVEWEKYRDPNCAVRSALAAGGSGSGQFVLGCQIAMTRARTDELFGLAAGTEL
jgi:uncharacterized protein YecT (DUF1311 family)